MIERDPQRATEMMRLRGMVEARMRRQAAGLAWDFTHVARVARNAQRLAEACSKEGQATVNGDVLEAAAILHEIGRSPHHGADTLAATTARLAEEMLRNAGLPELVWEVCATLVALHTQGRTPATWEARILRDAELLEDVGAVGVARALLIGADSAIPSLYDESDPRAEGRALDTHSYLLDALPHLVGAAETRACTEPGKREAIRRARVLTAYREALLKESGLA